MATQVEISLEEVKASGDTFKTESNNLKMELEKIDKELKAIQSENKLQGSAITQLLDAFVKIKKNLIGYADKFEVIGTSLITSAQNKEKINQVAENAAKIE